MPSRELVQMRVANGALLLDKKVPYWNYRIAKELSMGSTHNCILAQIFERYRTGVNKLEITDTEALEFGFRADHKEVGTSDFGFNRYYKLLSELWRAEVENRLNIVQRKTIELLKGTECEFIGFGPNAVAVMGDARFYGPCVFVRFPSGMSMEKIAKISTDITNEVPGIARVLMAV